MSNAVIRGSYRPELPFDQHGPAVRAFKITDGQVMEEELKAR